MKMKQLLDLTISYKLHCIEKLILFTCNRELFERRLNVTNPSQLRVEKIRFTKKEGATPEGCPIAKWVSSVTQETFCS